MTTTAKETRWSPSYYSDNSSIQLGHAQKLIEAHTFSGRENVLDIGCGDGKISAIISRFVPHGSVLGIDKSAEMIQLAKGRLTSAALSNLRFDTRNAQDIAYTQQFDLIASFSCLHFINSDEQLQVLRHVKQALKPGGKLLLMLYRKCPAQWAAIDSVANRPRWKPHFENFTPDFHAYLPDTYQALLEQAGLGGFRAHFTEVEYVTYAKPEMVSRFIKGWLPHVPRLPPDGRDDFVDEVVTQYLKNLGVAMDGPVRTPFVRLVVS